MVDAMMGMWEPRQRMSGRAAPWLQEAPDTAAGGPPALQFGRTSGSPRHAPRHPMSGQVSGQAVDEGNGCRGEGLRNEPNFVQAGVEIIFGKAKNEANCHVRQRRVVRIDLRHQPLGTGTAKKGVFCETNPMG